MKGTKPTDTNVNIFAGAAFPGEAPKLSMDAAAALNKPFHLGSMTSRDKPLYRVGTARTTKGFHDSLEERKQLHDRVYANDMNNNNNDSDEPKERRDSSDSTQSGKFIIILMPPILMGKKI